MLFVDNKTLKPSKKQLEFLSWEFGVFFHFGLRTFYPGYSDWDMREMLAENFNPQNLDCEEWIKASYEAGAKYAILTTKHHDGFANWPSEFTDYSVKNSPWKNGEGDVVREYVDACRKYGLKVGLYYSPADYRLKSEPITAEIFETYFINQISELLANYGKIDYLWFDGCGSENIEFNRQRIVDAIRGLQPEILIFNMWDPDTRWVGNENGIAAFDNSNIVGAVDFSVLADTKEDLKQSYFLPAECDVRIRHSHWFTADDTELNSVKSVDELIGIYDCSVGRGANLLLNIGPEKSGKLPSKDKQNLLEFGEKIKCRFSRALASVENPVNNNGKYDVSLNGFNLINMVVIEEDISEGESVKEFEIYASYPHITSMYPDGQSVFMGKTIGKKRICKFPTVRANKVTVKITNSDNETVLKKISVFYEE